MAAKFDQGQQLGAVFHVHLDGFSAELRLCPGQEAIDRQAVLLQFLRQVQHRGGGQALIVKQALQFYCKAREQRRQRRGQPRPLIAGHRGHGAVYHRDDLLSSVGLHALHQGAGKAGHKRLVR